jgi:hypothetical protein
MEYMKIFLRSYSPSTVSGEMNFGFKVMMGKNLKSDRDVNMVVSLQQTQFTSDEHCVINCMLHTGVQIGIDPQTDAAEVG